MIAIIDHDAGNLQSSVNALAKLGYQSVLTGDPSDVLGASIRILSDLIGILTRLGK